MSELASLKCPACRRKVTIEVKAELWLPPTGGDYDWCEGDELHPCPACRQRLRLRVRVYLDARATQVNATVAEPEPHRWAPRRLALSPDGATLAVHSWPGWWLVGRDRDGWGRPRLLPGAGDTRPDGPPFAWSSDDRLLVAGGRVVDATGRVCARLPWPYTTVLAMGWRDGAVVVAWRDLDGERWIAGVDVIDGAGGAAATRSIRWPADEGFVMGGRVMVAADGASLIRTQPPFHGSPRALLRRYQIDGGALTATAEVGDRHAIEAAHLAGDTLVLTTGHRAGDVWQREVEWLDAGSLAIRHTTRIPAAWLAGTDVLWDVVPLDGDRVLVLTSKRALLAHPAGEQLTAERQLRLASPCAAAWRDGALVVGGQWSLVEVRGDQLVAVPLPAP